MDNVIAFIEILGGSNYTCTTIGTYVSAIKAKCTEFDLPIEPWLHNKVARMLKAFARTAAFSPSIKHVLTPQLLLQLTRHVFSYPQGHIYQAIFLVAFHGFFSISNLLPPNKQAFNPLHHLTRGDVIVTPKGVSIILKWTKRYRIVTTHSLFP